MRQIFNPDCSWFWVFGVSMCVKRPDKEVKRSLLPPPPELEVFQPEMVRTRMKRAHSIINIDHCSVAICRFGSAVPSSENSLCGFL